MKTQLFDRRFAFLFAIAVLAAAVVVPVSAQVGAVPPAFVQVPFISLLAGGASSNCSGAFTVDGSAYGDGCPATQLKLPSGTAYLYSTAADKWGNVYYGAYPSTSSVGIVQVIYAGAVTVDGVANPATAMIETANPSNAWSTAPVTGDVYTIAGGMAVAPSSCTNGNTPSGNGSGCNGTESYIVKAYGVAVDAGGNVFVADESKSNVYVVLASTTGLAAQLVLDENTTLHESNLYVGAIYLVAGEGTGAYGDGVLATAGKIHNPYGIAVDAQDNLYITDYTANAVRMVNGPSTTTSNGGGNADCTTANGAPANGTCPAGFIHTIAGGGACVTSSTTACTAWSGTPSPTNQPAFGAEFVYPAGIAVDGWGNVYVGDNTNAASAPSAIRAIYAGGSNNPLASLIEIEDGVSSPEAGYVYTLAAGGATGGSSAKGDGLLGTNAGASFDRPYGLAVDKMGNIYVADYNSKGVVAELNAATGYLYYIQGYQAPSALANGDYCNGNGNGPKMSDAYGDGCPATQSIADHYYGNPSFDAQGNMYLADAGDGLIRKLTFTSFPATAVSSTAATQMLAFTLVTGTGTASQASNVSVSVSAQGSSSGEFARVSSGDTCTGSGILYGMSDSTAGIATSSTLASTCLVPITFTPVRSGLRTGAVQISATVGSNNVVSTAFASGIGQGQELAIDPSASTIIGAGTAPQGVATDAAKDTYIAWSNGQLSSTPGGPAVTPITEPNGNLHQIALDGAGDIYVADSGNNQIDELAAGSSAFTAAVTAVGGVDLVKPQGVAVDGAGNLYIADTSNKRVLMVPVSGEPAVLGSGFSFDVPEAVALDANGNVYVADTGLREIIEIPGACGMPTPFATDVAPIALAVDAAGDVIYADGSLEQVVEIPVSGANAVIASGLTSPEGLALDGNGGVYLADTANTGIAYYARSASAQSFPSLNVGATVSSIGNVAYSGTISSTDSTDFELSDASDNGCAGTTSLALAVGQNCGFTALFTPSGTGNLSDTITLTDASSVNGNPELTLTGYNAAPTVNTTTAISVDTPGPVYGSSVELTVAVTAASGTTAPGGTVTYTVDNGTAVGPESLGGGTGATSNYTLMLSGLSAGQHTISATYTPGAADDFNTSNVTNVAFTLAPLAITASATSQSSIYGQPIPAISGSLIGVLSADTSNVTAVFATTATPTSPVATYPITVTLGGSAENNYSVTLTGTPTVSIAPATVTLAIANATRIYGAANPAFSGTFTGALSQDMANLFANYSTAAGVGSPVGSYPITATALSGLAAGNYKLGTVANGTLSVTALAITATANPISVPYGETIPAITGALSGVLAADVGNVTAVFSTTAKSTSPVGSYPISVSLTGSAAGNYTVTLSSPASVTMATSAVAVAVNNATRAYGAANPAFTGTLNGVLPQDVANVEAVYSTTAITTSSVGTYPITVQSLAGSAAANYALGAVTPGTLTVTQAATTTTITTSGASVGSGEPVTFTATVTSATTGTPTGSVVFSSNGITLGSTLLSGGVANYTSSSLPTGTLSITAAYAGNTDFSTSTSAALGETITVPIVTGTTSTLSVSVSAGGSATVTVGSTALGGYVGTATYSCALLPVGMACGFSPATATFSATSTTASTTLTISTNGQTSSSNSSASITPAQRTNAGKAPLTALAGILAGLWMLARSRKKLRQYIAVLMLLLAGMAGAGSLSGCGGSASSNHTPAGTYNILVEITAGTVQTIPLTVAVQ